MIGDMDNSENSPQNSTAYASNIKVFAMRARDMDGDCDHHYIIKSSGVPTGKSLGLFDFGVEYIDTATGKHYYKTAAVGTDTWGIVTSA
jgi:hypothetical protein